MEAQEADFSGWATRNDLECADGRTIKAGAFKHMDKVRVPLVWMHQHNEPDNVLGHAILEDRAFGVYTHGYFNNTPRAQHIKESVMHGDLNSLSIYANKLTERRVGKGREVYHGDIKEVSLVLAGANPGALIENVNIRHGDEFKMIDEEAIIWTGLDLEHSDTLEGEDTMAGQVIEHADEDKTVADVLETFNEEQKSVLYFLVGEAAGEDGEDSDDAKHDDIDAGEFLQHVQDTVNSTIKEGFQTMNLFEKNDAASAVEGKTLSHDQMKSILDEARAEGSLKKVVQSDSLAHEGTYGVNDIEILFPDHKSLDSSPQIIGRRVEWVASVLSGVKKVPFAKIKTLLADITAEEARAKGYVKGTMKKDEVIELLKRTTGPTTVYKKQKLDRDDILDITDFDIVVWLKAEIRLMLDEEIARAILVGDGRSSSNPDKIKDPQASNEGSGIRSIANDHDTYAHKIDLAANVTSETAIDEITRARGAYRGSGNPTLYTTDSILTDMLLEKDRMGRRLYATQAELASVLRVKEIVAVEVMEEYAGLYGIIVNLIDYTVGANKGGELTFFSDFDIDFNQEKYLLETRISGALTKPKSAVVIRRNVGTPVTPVAPSFDGPNNTITIPTATGVDYFINDEAVDAGDYEIDEDSTVTARAAEEHYLVAGSPRSWSFNYNG